MTGTTMDTHTIVRELQNTGFKADQAEAITRAIHSFFQLDQDRAITREHLDLEIARLRGDLYRAMLIQGGAIVAIITGVNAITGGGS
ncbi:MAG: hypothetical protein OXC05_11230 [Halieaceae bacterium]|nr:hypothetical protein [Halieaceae bacterium]